MGTKVTHIASRDNELVKQLRQLAAHNTAYRKLGRYWVEGEHLCQAALTRGQHPELAVFAESAWLAMTPAWLPALKRVAVLSDKLFESISALESTSRLGFVMALPELRAAHAGVASVILDRVQDAGNVGSILRSASAFGFQQVLALKGSAALWSPKVLRAGMGAHFGLHLVEALDVDAVLALELPLLVTSSHQGLALHAQALPWPCNWAFGHEGQGVSEALMSRAALPVRIAQPGGEESLNVAAAAAICLHASVASRPASSGPD